MVIDQLEVKHTIGPFQVRPMLNEAGALRGYEFVAIRCECFGVIRDLRAGPIDVQPCDEHVDEIERAAAVRRWTREFRFALGPLAHRVRTRRVGRTVGAWTVEPMHGRPPALNFNTLTEPPADAARRARWAWAEAVDESRVEPQGVGIHDGRVGTRAMA